MAAIRWALRRGAPGNPWLARLLERKPPMVAALAQANKMARGIRAMLTTAILCRLALDGHHRPDR